MLREAGISLIPSPPPPTAAAAAPAARPPSAPGPPARHGGPAAFASYDPLTRAALAQGLLRQRDMKGRFIPKHTLARYAVELVRRGLMVVPQGVDAPMDAPDGGEPVETIALYWAGAPVEVDPAVLAAAGVGVVSAAGNGGGGNGGGGVKREGGAAGGGAGQHSGPGVGLASAKRPQMLQVRQPAVCVSQLHLVCAAPWMVACGTGERSHNTHTYPLPPPKKTQTACRGGLPPGLPPPLHPP
jgi:hypothetical protein